MSSSKPSIPSASLPWGPGWRWPIPDIVLDGVAYPAVISQEFHAPAHMGVDLMYHRRSIDDQVAKWGPGKGGTTQFFCPDGVDVIACRDARIWSVDKGPRGISIVLDHGSPWATFYTHLSSTMFPPHQSGFPGGDRTKTPTTVRAGDSIGKIGIDPLDGSKVRHLHFVPWYNGHGDSAAVDPGAEMMMHWARETQTL